MVAGIRRVVYETPDPMWRLLSEEDHNLMQLWHNGQVTTQSLAGVLGCSRGTVSRRLKSIRQRIAHPWATLIARYQGDLSPAFREVAIRRHIHGQPRAQIARELGMRLHRVRDILEQIGIWCEQHNRQSIKKQGEVQ